MEPNQGSLASSLQSHAGDAAGASSNSSIRGDMADILRDVLLPQSSNQTDVDPPATDTSSGDLTGEEMNSAGAESSSGNDPSQLDPTTGDNPPDDDTGNQTGNEDGADGPSKGLAKRNEALEAQKQELKANLAERKALLEELRSVDEAVARVSAPVEACNSIVDLERCLQTASVTEGVLEKILRRATRQGLDEITVQDAAAAAGESAAAWEASYGPDKRWSVEELEQRLEGVRQDIRTGIPDRAKFIQQREGARRLACEAFGYLKDKANPLHAAALAARREFPALNKIPHADMVISYTLMGEALTKAALSGQLDPVALSALRKYGGFTGQPKSAAPAAARPKPRPVASQSTSAPAAGDKWALVGKDHVTTRNALREMLSGGP